MTPPDNAPGRSGDGSGDSWASADRTDQQGYVPPQWDSWSDPPEAFPEFTHRPPREGRAPDEGTVPPQPESSDDEATEVFHAFPSHSGQGHPGQSRPGQDASVFSGTAATTGSLAQPDPSDEPTDHDLPVGLPSVRVNQMIADRYRLEEELTQRHQTLTWRAFDTKLSRAVLVHAIAATDPRRHAVLEAARRSAIATDSRFLRVLDAVSDDAQDGTYIICEYVPGESLERLLAQGPLSVLEAAWVVRELADALTPMHAAGLFHGMLTPDTVLVTATGSVKIVGFLIDAALAPDGHPTAAWSDREEADVRALGQLLYACLVTRWPTMDESDRTWWGLRAAPFDAKGWLTPRQVRAGVSPALDQVCDQILHERPRLGGAPLRSAAQVDQALSRVLGTAEASADLEHRVRHPQARSGIDDTLSDLTGTGRVPVAAVGAAPTPRSADTPDELEAGPSTRLLPAHDGVHGPDHPRTRPSTSRPWLRVLLVLVLVSVVVGLVAVALHRTGKPGAGPVTTPSPSAARTLPISKVDDFDPTTDGGNDEENPNQVALAWDGKPTTAWTTLTYRGNPKLGGLKPGVGLVVDLGQSVTVGSVRVTLQGSPTAIAVMVPQGNAASVTEPDMSSVKKWRQVAVNGEAGTSVTLSPSKPVTTRFVLVYLTSLPKVDAGRYRAGISELQVTT
ncbi:protein kinase family protein [Aestuariimicrobium sp. T2.26MG-19.2B]|uniref:protein kinase family protein n=1 Tax=Aestuariimicrobium sp. T2.26MG-19.2B TaxID=3040679 RepID=UPI00247771FC|nr:protein kinase family protein [Aestuariimicrobium sp. T2.26MG-19.2B]CAI9403849.1 hypothetical protein AESSP_01087 [Aestuariimicrobium sp. T2.26MG-19.2B]